MPVPDIGTQLPMWSALPFVGMLLSIALLPLLAPHLLRDAIRDVYAEVRATDFLRVPALTVP